MVEGFRKFTDGENYREFTGGESPSGRWIMLSLRLYAKLFPIIANYSGES